MLILKRTDSADTDFNELVKLLDTDLALRNGEQNAFYSQFNKTDTIRNVVVAYLNHRAVSCGAFKYYNDNTVEIKRMFTVHECRGKGLAVSILKELETWAAELGYTRCILETGKKQTEALNLYQKNHYQLISNYGQYAGIENSICFQKFIKV